MRRRLSSSGSADRRPVEARWYALVLTALLAFVHPASPAAQDRWEILYQDAESAYRAKDFRAAEEKIRAVLRHPSAPKQRGRSVLIVSQRRGYYPEAYLALVCLELGNRAEAKQNFDAASKYLQRGDPLFESVRIAGIALGGQGVDSNQLLTWAREASSSGQYDTALSYVDRAAEAGAALATVDTVRRDVQRQQSTALLKQGEEAFGRGRYADARRIADQVATLGVDKAGATALHTKIGDAEERALVEQRFTEAIKNAEQAITDKQFDAADTALQTAAGMNVNATRVEEMRGRLTSARAAAMPAAGNSVTPGGVAPGGAAPGTAMPPAGGPSIAGGGSPAGGRAGAAVPAPAGGGPVVRTANPVRDGALAFYRGAYGDAIKLLGGLTGLTPFERARADLYLASSKIALSVSNPADLAAGKEAERVRQAFSLTESQRRLLAQDLRYLSPAIRDSLRLAAN